MLINIIIATIAISAISLTGVVFFFRRPFSPKQLRPLISLAAGTLLGLTFLDILPEAIEQAAGIFEPHLITLVILLSILGFFLFERVWHWHHCSDDLIEHRHPHNRSVAYLNLIGDGVHNLIDGFIIASAFLLDWRVGIATTLAVAIHEIPQEIADFSILLHSGLSRAKAIFANALVALIAVVGGVVFFFWGSAVENTIPIMAAIAAGNFIYLAMSDLIPELHHETNRPQIAIHTLWLFVGVAVIYLVTILLPHTG
ncbi:hypothetical protein A2810_02165 [candidate division Kazan bacterium RIFCSPHIGHO2_01_FULL_49_10]|uniref:ZIP zinc transporter n=1 Tax=candidate division Kazan bacterium RIFCSPLOWO2_01_FULL_48_13 TaxID=1798539 RepID=A0A1F4PM95_UNCK3|nr:MAG: hypothetical protein A2810_02165 [candidate division Kazan bacterium RIFCSPHIGHO2_01_FULL_49_10]OGB84983.1 MAG: hypothetical protein A2994_01350 [candidate division Kazan bacterium RIFCSPLOWO2_01_FULL_48_13]